MEKELTLSSLSSLSYRDFHTLLCVVLLEAGRPEGAAEALAAAVDHKSAFEEEVTKSKLKIAVATESFTISLKEFATNFIDENASYPLTKYIEHHAIECL